MTSANVRSGTTVSTALREGRPVNSDRKEGDIAWSGELNHIARNLLSNHARSALLSSMMSNQAILPSPRETAETGATVTLGERAASAASG
jgi:hypothetical protein